MSDQAVRYEVDQGVAIVRLDDGKANALSHAVLDALHEAFDRADAEKAAAVALVGRPGRFSAGFDLSVMSRGVDQVGALVGKGARLAMRIVEWPTPVVLGATGHALAMGAVLLLAADERIGADGPFKVGLNEVAIGMTLPDFAIQLARERISHRHLQRATGGAEIYAPRDAVDAGYLDRVVEPERVGEVAIARAQALATTLHAGAHRATKRAVRAELIERLRKSLGADFPAAG